ncbi:MAG: hypothetical protein COA49_01870 [Bacteroidetes bacterium]|nr:MAG: hypothetical protein COA49_01870 [Bacteroidota bacterium]
MKNLLSLVKSSSFALAFVIIYFTFSNSFLAQSSCPDGQSEIIVEIISDGYPQEISWNLNVAGNEIASGSSVGDTICVEVVEELPCFEFEIFDSFGDGIFEPGGYWIYFNGVEIASGGNYNYGDAVSFECSPGTTCNDAVELTEPSEMGDVITQVGNDFWYTFTPANNGMYNFSSCGTGCDTKLYVYEYCNMSNFDDTNIGTIYYDDNQGGCGEEASQTMLLEGGVTYWIRWYSLEGCTVNWDWVHTFMGPPAGCTDIEACNYNPQAEVDNGSCIYPGDPDCTGPDLIVVEQAIVNSIQTDIMEVSESDCYIGEGCLNGYGSRELIRFTTHIKNIGDLDYFIGQPSNSNFQFEFADCHNHWHHKGYAKYDLFELDGTYIPIGFKNGFCVMDLECSDGGTGQYGCSNMGISSHCGDIYSSGLSCQWIDVTDVADGTYFLIVRANWDFIPDALGREETDYSNNYASVCLNIDRSMGSMQVNVYTDCEPFYDCSGTLFGQSSFDCNGNCNGDALIGDLDLNGAQEYTDAVSYVEGILGNDIDVASCTDIDQDDEITVSDAALMSRCQYWNEAHTHPDSSGFHDKCNFPVNEIINIYDTTHFQIGDINWEQGYLDIHILNPNNRVVGYQLEFSGIEISQAISLADVVNYPITPSFVPGGAEVIGLSYEGESMMKFYEWTPFLRLYWQSVEEDVCILSCIDVVSDLYQNTLTEIIQGCVGAVQLANNIEAKVTVVPNPISSNAIITFPNPMRDDLTLQIIDSRGRVVRTELVRGTQHVIEKRQLSSGAYFFNISGVRLAPISGRFDIQ